MRDSDWLNFIHFSRYKYKIWLVSIIGKRENQELMSLSTILKFSALDKISLQLMYNTKIVCTLFLLNKYKIH